MHLFKTIAALAVFGTGAQAGVIDAFDLNVLNNTGTDSTAILDVGVDYQIEISGTFFIGSGVTGLADAEYFDVPTAPGDIFIGDIGVQINGVDIDWGSYTPTTIYTTTFTGLGNTVNLSYFDNNNYGDNSGALQVRIIDPSAVPVPASLGFALVSLGALGWIRRKQS